MITETTKKILWVPYVVTKGRTVDTNPAPVATINRKFGYLSFGGKAIEEMGMNGKFIKFYFEPTKKVIGWQLRTEIKQEEMKNWKLVKQLPNKTWKVTITKLLAQFNGRLTKGSYTHLPVQKYREINPLSEYRNEVFYFVELVEDPEELKKGIGDGTQHG